MFNLEQVTCSQSSNQWRNSVRSQDQHGFSMASKFWRKYRVTICGWWRLQKWILTLRHTIYVSLFRRLDAYERTLSTLLPSHSRLREQMRSKCTRNLFRPEYMTLLLDTNSGLRLMVHAFKCFCNPQQTALTKFLMFFRMHLVVEIKTHMNRMTKG